MSKPPPGTPAIPADRMMPAEQRLTPPAWPGGRADAPGGEFHVIGKRNRKVEGLAKVTGRAIYADDIALPRMLHGKLLRSPHAHARIRSIDVIAGSTSYSTRMCFSASSAISSLSAATAATASPT